MKLPYNMVYLLHMLFVGPLLVYAGYTGYSNCAKQHDKGIFLFLGAIGLFVALYHAMMYIKIKMI